VTGRPADFCHLPFSQCRRQHRAASAWRGRVRRKKTAPGGRGRIQVRRGNTLLSLEGEGAAW